MNADQLTDKIRQEYERTKAEVQKPNILIVGGTGVGKSSLINLCFGRVMAQVAVGVPVTQRIEKFAAPNVPVVIYDTKGYEVGTEGEREFLEEVVGYVKSRADRAVEDDIHIVWYCIQASGHRVTEADKEYIGKLKESGKPVAVLLTKCDLVTEDEIDAMKAELGDFGPNTPIFLVTEKNLGDGFGHLDVEKLLAWSLENLDKGLQLAFVNAQRFNMALKRNEASNIVLQHIASAAAVAAVPIPFSDAPLLLANQGTMLGRILYVYDMEGLLSNVGSLVSGMGAGTAVSSFGIMVCGTIFKFIPGLGSVFGGMINATVASAITGAIGYTVSEICFRLSEFALNGNAVGAENLMAHLDQTFKDIFNEHVHGQRQAAGV